MTDFTLRQLRYGLALARTGHFGQAATQCHITQPALSQQIRQMEDACGTKLFERTGRSVRPTPFGREFLARAARLVADAEALAEFARSPGGNPGRPVRLGMIPTIAPYLLPLVYPLLRSDLPAVRFEAHEDRTEPLLDGLASGELDMALIATEPPAKSGLVESRLFADPFVLATASTDDRTGPVDLAKVPGDHIMLLDEGHCLRDQALEACALRDRDASRSFSATSLSTIVELVAHGQGVTLLPAISLRKEAADRRIAIHALAAPGAGRLLRLVWRADTPFGPLFEEVAGLIQQAGAARLAEAIDGE